LYLIFAVAIGSEIMKLAYDEGWKANDWAAFPNCRTLNGGKRAISGFQMKVVDGRGFFEYQWYVFICNNLHTLSML